MYIRKPTKDINKTEITDNIATSLVPTHSKNEKEESSFYDILEALINSLHYLELESASNPSGHSIIHSPSKYEHYTHYPL